MPQLLAVVGFRSLFNQECIAPSFKLFAFCDVTSLIGKPFIRINANQEKAAASMVDIAARMKQAVEALLAEREAAEARAEAEKGAREAAEARSEAEKGAREAAELTLAPAPPDEAHPECWQRLRDE